MMCVFFLFCSLGFSCKINNFGVYFSKTLLQCSYDLNEFIMLCMYVCSPPLMVYNLVLALHVFDQVDDTVGVTEFVVVPGDQLDELIVEGDTSLGIED